MATRAPSRSNSCAAANPIPLLPPVIRIFLSDSLPTVVTPSSSIKYMTIVMIAVRGNRHISCQGAARRREMRVSREKAAENRERIVDAASRLFREKGFDGVGLDAIMKDAGLTHGGFYGHFGSKDDLASEAVTRALEQSMQKQG